MVVFSMGDQEKATGEVVLTSDVPQDLQAKKDVFEKKTGSAYMVCGKKETLYVFVERNAEPYALFDVGGVIERWAVSRAHEIIALKGALNERQATAVVQGIILSSHDPGIFKTKKKEKSSLKEVRLENGWINEQVLKEAVVVAEAQNYARQLDEVPSNITTPKKFAEEAKRLADKYGFKCVIMDEIELRKRGFGGTIAVGQGSVNPPHFVVLEYGDPQKEACALVGKGVVFDAGGISLKPSRGLEEMKYDKTGACMVLGVFKAVAEMGLDVHLIGYVPLVENMPSGSAIKPGDIITIYGGKTVELINTDAEGRLILADALAYASEHEKVRFIVDAATLTGAIIIALGQEAIGLFANKDEIAKKVVDQSKKVGERVWWMPLWDEYRKMLDSAFADIKNLGSERGSAGSITAAMFLKEFVNPEKEWVHLDIAGMMTLPESKCYRKGATAHGMKLMYALVKNFEPE